MENFLRRNIFLVDGLGGLVSALMLGLVLPHFEIGLPKVVLAALSLTALAFGLYSFGCFLFKRKVGIWLTAVAIANTLYCIVTTTVVGYFYGELTQLGIAYFLGEVVVVLLLVRLELRISRQSF